MYASDSVQQNELVGSFHSFQILSGPSGYHVLFSISVLK